MRSIKTALVLGRNKKAENNVTFFYLDTWKNGAVAIILILNGFLNNGGGSLDGAVISFPLLD